MPLLSLLSQNKISHSLIPRGSVLLTTIVGSAQSRLLRISKEIAGLVSSLPLHSASSIFVRADESRLDVMKALLTGPPGTPYENGVFVFDILLPPNYPTERPEVLIATTGGGTVRFNPNLYKEGKVCLSLLGTWEGPGWDPKISTLLQVLISIQSLIMVPNPFFNEPGYDEKSPQWGPSSVK